MRLAATFLTLASALVLAGCVSIDSRASREEVDVPATQAISGDWIPRSVYSKFGQQTLGDLLLGDRHADRVRVDFDPAAHRIGFEFWSGEQRTAARVFGPERLRVDEHGAIELKPEGGCRVDGAIECDADTLTLFVNRQHEMVIVKSHGVGGAILVIPVAGYQKTVTTFLRLTGDRDLDNVVPIRP